MVRHTFTGKNVFTSNLNEHFKKFKSLVFELKVQHYTSKITWLGPFLQGPFLPHNKLD